MATGIIWRGILLGLGAAAPIGPVNVEIARRSIRGGMRAGFLLGCGAVTVDMTYLLLAGLSLEQVVKHRFAGPVLMGLGIVGTALLAYLGVMSLRSAARRHEAEADLDWPVRRNYLTGLAMTSLNPMTLVFWFGAAPNLTVSPGREMPYVAAGVFVGTIIWVILFSALMSVAGRVSKRRTMIMADLAGGVMLLGFAILTIWRWVGLAL